MQAFVSFVGDVPVASEYWQDDSFYGAHFMNGCNPDTIKRCTKLPSSFPVTQELVGNLLDEGDTLEKAMKVLSREPLRQFIFNCCAHAYYLPRRIMEIPDTYVRERPLSNREINNSYS